MKRKIVAMLLSGVMALSITACGGGDESKPEPKQDAKVEESKDEKETVTYEMILNEYTEKIKEATPKLVEEYNAESAEISTDLEALAELSNSKVSKLAEISNEGISKMAELQLKNGSEYSEYEEWAKKLSDVYTEYGKQITDAYTSSASGMSAEDMLNSLESMTE